MSIEDLNVSAVDADQAVTEFSSEFQADSHQTADIEVAQAIEDAAAAKSDRLPAEAAAVAERPKEVVPDQNNIARLPANVTVDEIRVEGPNLILVQADGTEVTVINGALHIPTFIIGDVEVPQQVLLAVLEQDGINVAAGPDGSYSATGAGQQSSGGDFQDSLQQGDQDAGPLAELLANTELNDPNGDGANEENDDVPIITDTAVTFITETADGNGSFESQSIDGVFGFVPGRDTGQIVAIGYVNTLNLNEPNQTGSITALTSGGVPVIVTASADGLTLTGTAGGVIVFTLTVTNTANGAFTFQQLHSLDHPDQGEKGADDLLRLQFTYTVTDKDGDTVIGNASIDIADDSPVANVGTASTVEDEAVNIGNNEADGLSAGVSGVSLNINWGADSANAGGLNDRSVAFTNATVSVSNAFGETLTSLGQTVSTVLINGVLVGYTGETAPTAITGEGSSNVVFFASVSDVANGTYDFTLVKPLDHASGKGENSLSLTFNYTATDSDGDTSASTFTVNVVDDAPVANVGTASTVEDEAVNNGNNEADGLSAGVSGVSLNIDWGSDNANAGGLNDRSVAFTGKTVAVSGAYGETLTSLGQTVSTVLINGVLVGYTGETAPTAITGEGSSNVVFFASVSDVANGTYDFTLVKPLDHASGNGENSLSLTFNYTATDSDGDTSASTFTVNVVDDAPVANVGTASTVEDEAVNNGNNEADGLSAGVSGVSLNINWGADSANAGGLNDRSVAFTDKTVAVSGAYGETLTSLGQTVSTVLINGVLVGYTGETAPTAVTGEGSSNVVFFASVSDVANGTYDFTLVKPLDHASGNGENSLSLTFNYTATDSDGDTSASTFTVNVVDDAPVANVGTASTVEDEAVNNGNNEADGLSAGVSGVSLNIDWGSDNANAGGLNDRSVAFTDKTVAVSGAYGETLTSLGQTVSTVLINGVLVGYTGETAPTAVTGEGSSNVVFFASVSDVANGTYDFTLVKPLDHASGNGENSLSLTFNYTATDSDGDTSASTFTVNVVDDIPVSRGDVTATTVLDDEAQTLFPGNAGAALLGDVSPNVKTVSGGAGSLFSMGADGLGSIALTAPAFGVVYKDSQGFAQTEAVSWSVGPTSVNGTTTWTATSAHYTANTPAAVLVVNADGSYTLTLNAPVAHSLALPGIEENAALKFSYTVTDGDADTTTGSLTVNVNDDTPRPIVSVVAPSTVLDDEAQSVFPGNAGGLLDVANVKTVSGAAGSLFSMGADGLGSIALALPGFDVVYKDANGFAKTESVDWSAGIRSADGTTTWTATSGHYGTDAPVAILVIKADGSYSFSLDAPVAHALGQPLFEENTALTIGYGVTDGDGDQAGGLLTIQVNDDKPVASNVTPTTFLDDEAQTVFTPVNTGGTNDVAVDAKTVTGGADSLFSMGSDGLGAIALTAPAFKVVFQDANGFAQTESVSWSAGVPSAGGTTTWTATSGHYGAGSPAAVLVIKADGSYSFTINAPVAHSAVGTSEDNKTLDFNYKVTDGDGDSVSARLRLNINDDTPVSKGAITATTVLDDDAFAGGNAGGTGDVANATVATGVAGTLFTAGADGVDSITLTAPAFDVVFKNADGFAQTESVSWSVPVTSAGGTTTWTATSGHYPAGTPAAVLVIKADGSYSFTTFAPVAHTASGTTEENATLTFGYSVKDGDGDTATGSLAVRVNDDTPVSTGSVTAATVLDDEAQTVFPGNAGGLGDVANVKTVSGAAGSLFSMGADGLGSIVLTAPAFGVIFKDTQGFAQTETVSWNGGARSADGTTTWTATSAHYTSTPAAVLVIKADGSYTLTVNAPVAHSLALPGIEENAALKFSYTVTDGDTDTATGSLTVNVNDDAPRPVVSVVAPSTVLDDEAQSVFPGNAGGLLDVANVKTVSGAAGSLFSMGSDGLGSISVAPPAFSVVYKDANGFAQTESVDWSAGIRSADGTTTWTATSDHYPTGTPAAILVIKADGSYSFGLDAPVAHALGQPLFEENAALNIGYTVTDGDGDAATGLLTIQVNDDKPVASNVTPTTILDDEAQTVFTPVNTGGTDDVAVDAKTVSGGADTLFSMGSDGLAAITVAPPAFKVVFQDANGFAQTESVNWSAGTPSAGGTTTWMATSAHYTGATPAAVLVIKADGSYSFTINAPVAHSAVGTSEDNKTLDFTYTVTDGDGDSASARLRLNINDDTPVSKGAIIATTVLDDDAFAGGNAGGTGDVANATVATGVAGTLFTAGADGVNSITLTAAPAFNVIYKDGSGLPQTESVNWSAGTPSAGGTTTWTATSGHYPAGTPAAILVIKADGSYTFTTFAPVAHATPGTAEENKALTFGYSVKDGDGDTATGSLTVNVNDDTPTIPATATQRAGVNDDALAGGNPEAGDKAVATGVLSHSFGADCGSLSWQSPTLPTGGYTSQITGNTIEVFQSQHGVAVKVFAAVLNPVTGDYTVTQYAAIHHPTGNGEQGEGFNLNYRVTDGDGDTADSVLRVVVGDDTPTIGTPEAGALTENTVQVALANGSFEATSLATDAPGVTTDYVRGNYTYGSPAGWTISGGTGGVYAPTGTIVDAVNHAGGNVVWLREGAMLSQDTGEIVGEGESYTIRLNVADRTDQDWPGGEVRIVATDGVNSVVLASQTLPVPANGTWTSVELNSLALTPAQAAALAGYHIRIEIQQTSPGNGNQILIDNVELSTMPALSDTGSLAINWGSDNDPALRSVAFDTALTTNSVVNTANGGLTSNGKAVLLVRVSATELLGVADDDGNGLVDANGRVVFKVTLDDGAAATDKGSWTFKLLDNIDHSPAANDASLGLSFGFTATDSDGDSIGGKSFTVALSDDAPVLVSPVTGVTLDEDDLRLGTDASKEALSATGTLNIDLGADGGKIALSASGANWDAGKSTLSAVDGSWKVVLNGDGTYTFTLLNNTLLHGPNANNGENQLNLTINYLATDGDGDTLPGSFTVGIVDDAPVINGTAQTGALSETSLPLVSSTFGSLNVNLGADYQNSHVSIGLKGDGTPIINAGLTSDGVPLDYIVRTTNGVDQELVAFKHGDPAGAANPVFIVAVLHNGSFAATLYQNLDHAAGDDPLVLEMSARVFDGDGDYVDRTFSINVADDVPVMNGPAQTGSLSEAGLPLVSSTFGSLNIDIGSDKDGAHVSIGMNGNVPLINAGLTSDGIALDYIVRTTNGVDQELVAFKHGDAAGAANPVFIVAVLHNGSFAATLYQNLDHPAGNDPLVLNMSARVYDGDGDYVDQPFTINIADTVPVLVSGASVSGDVAENVYVPETQTFASGAVNLGIADNSTITSNIVVPAGGTIQDVNVSINLSHTFMSDLQITLIAPDGTRITLVNREGGGGDPNGVIKFDDEAASPFSSASQPFVGTWRPTSSALSLLDGKDMSGTWKLEVKDLAGADIGVLHNWGLEIQTPVAFSTTNVNLSSLVAVGADDINGGAAFSLKTIATAENLGTVMAGGHQVKIVSDGTTLTGYADGAPGTPLFTLQVSATGVATFVLKGELDHGTGIDTLRLDLGAYVQARDGDGDTVVLGAGQFFVNVADSLPTATNVAATMTENESKSVTLVEGVHFTYGADETGANVSFGTPSYTGVPNGITLGTPAVTFDNATHTVSIVPGTAFDALAAGQTVVMHVPYTVADGDGDLITKDIAITITGTNDIPVIDLDTQIAGNGATTSAVEQLAQQFAWQADLSDVDTQNLHSMTLTLGNIQDSGLEILKLNTTATNAASGLTVGPYNTATGTLLITGTASITTYETILKNIVYVNNDDDSTAGNRTVTVVVNDGLNNSAAQVATINFAPVNDAPQLKGTLTATVAEGATHIFTLSQLGYNDPDDLPSGVTFITSNVLRGTIVNGNAPTITFTAQEVIDGKIKFIHDGSESPTASFNVTVEDGNEDTSVPAVGTFNLTVTPVNDLPVISSGSTASEAENTASNNVVYQTVASDVDPGSSLTYSLTGADANRFNISSTGAVTFKASPNFEAPADVGGNNVYDVVVNVTDNAGATVTKAVAISVTNVNEAPVITSGATGTEAENTAISNVVYQTVASDPEGVALTYSLTGADANLFNISSAGAVTFKASPNFEAPADSGGNNVYDIVVNATDGVNAAVTKAVAISVTNVNEAPVITSGATGSEAENTAVSNVVYQAVASDPEGAALTYTLTGADANRFNISSTGAVTFKVSPNFEAPTDVGGNNIYDINVNVTDGVNAAATKAVAISVTDVNEALPLPTSLFDLNDYAAITHDGQASTFVKQVTNGATGSAVLQILVRGDYSIGSANEGLSVYADNTFLGHFRITSSGVSGDSLNSNVTSYAGGVVANYGSEDIAWNVGISINSTLFTALAANGSVQIKIDNDNEVNSFGGLGDFIGYRLVYNGGASDPIILDLDHNGIALTSLENGVAFDINADGAQDHIAWTAGSDGILAYDLDGNGKIDNGSEIFSPDFAGGKYSDGLAALATLDTNHDGKIDATDTDFAKLLVWQDLNHNGITDQGELLSLTDHAITSLSLDAHATNMEIDGQSILAQGSYSLADGSTGSFVEVAFDSSLGENGSLTGTNSLFDGTSGDDILAAGLGHYAMTGGAGADTFVLDVDAFKGIELADVITDYKAGEGDVLDVSSLLTSLLGHDASEADAMANVKTTVSGDDTVVSVNDNGAWHDVAVLQDYTSTVKVLYDDDHNATAVSHTV